MYARASSSIARMNTISVATLQHGICLGMDCDTFVETLSRSTVKAWAGI